MIGGRAGHIWNKHTWGGNDHKDGVVAHGRNRKFGGNGGELRGVQVFSMNLYTNKIVCTQETTSKREKASKLEGVTKVSKTKENGKQNKNSKNKREKETTGQNKKHSKKPKVLQASEQQRSGQKLQKPGQQGIYRTRKKPAITNSVKCE